MPQSNSTKANHESFTEKLKAWSELINSVANFFRSLAPWLWAIVVIIVIIPLLGKAIIAHSFDTSSQQKTDKLITVSPADWGKIDNAVKKALQTARQKAQNYAQVELDLWSDDLMGRIDPNFLNWYFGYFNQKGIEYKSFFAGITGVANYWFNPNNQTPEEKIAEEITTEFQTEFTKRVLRPEIAQLQLQRITNQTIRLYLDEVSQNIKLIPINYKISQVDWNRYLNDVAITIYDTEGHLSNVSLKVFAGGGAYLAVKPIVAKLVVGSKIVTKLAGKVGAKIATKTGATLAAKIGGTLLDTTIGVGILLWDVWDNNHTAFIEKPILKENLANYLKEVEDSLLNNPETGVMVAVDSIQKNIINAIHEKAISSINLRFADFEIGQNI
ncbi:MAG: hypothetical protein ACOYMQ_08005 [Pseudanabaena sp.]